MFDYLEAESVRQTIRLPRTSHSPENIPNDDAIMVNIAMEPELLGT